MEEYSENVSETAHPEIDPELWVKFANARGDEEFCHYWLEIQCSILSNVIQGVLVLGEPDKESYSPFSKWPEEGEEPERLTEISERVIEEQCGLLVELKPPGPHIMLWRCLSCYN